MNARTGFALLALTACSAPPPTPTSTSIAPSRDAQASHEPTSAPSDGQRLLARMAGTFTVTKTFHPRDGGAPTVTHGTCDQHLVHGGRFLQSDFTFTTDAGPVTGTGVIGYDGQSGRFTSFWYDARSTRTSIRLSEPGFDGTRIVLWSHALPGDSNPRRSRTESTLVDGDRVLQHRQWNVAADGSERLVMAMDFVRHDAR